MTIWIGCSKISAIPADTANLHITILNEEAEVMFCFAENKREEQPPDGFIQPRLKQHIPHLQITILKVGWWRVTAQIRVRRISS